MIGDYTPINYPLLVRSSNPIIGVSTNTLLSGFEREYNGSKASLFIYGYPNTDLVMSHLRNSVMLYSTSDAKNMIFCAAPDNGTIRFFTDDWDDPTSERVRITNTGMGIGTIDPKEKLHISDGDIYIEDIDRGVVMKSPNGQCWRMTVSNQGTPIFNSVNCPN